MDDGKAKAWCLTNVADYKKFFFPSLPGQINKSDFQTLIEISKPYLRTAFNSIRYAS